MSFFKRDDWWLGLVLGLFMPAILYGIIMLVLMQWGTLPQGGYVLKPSTSQLLALFSNLIGFRYYMVNRKFDKTGRGILLATIAYAGMYFYFYL